MLCSSYTTCNIYIAGRENSNQQLSNYHLTIISRIVFLSSDEKLPRARVHRAYAPRIAIWGLSLATRPVPGLRRAAQCFQKYRTHDCLSAILSCRRTRSFRREWRSGFAMDIVDWDEPRTTWTTFAPLRGTLRGPPSPRGKIMRGSPAKGTK